MNLPPFVKSLAFWKAFSFAAAGILAALAALGKIPSEWALSAGAILAAVLTVLEWFNITPELRLRALQVRYESLLEAHRALLADVKGVKMDSKSAKKSTK